MTFLTRVELNARGYEGNKVAEAFKVQSHPIRTRLRTGVERNAPREFHLDDVIAYQKHLESLKPTSHEITTTEACEIIQCSAATVRSAVLAKRLKARFAGRKMLLDRESVEMYAAGIEPEPTVTMNDILTCRSWSPEITAELEACHE